jgi:hypothetical protein
MEQPSRASALMGSVLLQHLTSLGVSYCEVSETKNHDPAILVIQNWPSSGAKTGTREKVPSEISYSGNEVHWGCEIPLHFQRHRWTKLELDSPKPGEAARIRKELSASAYGVVGGSGYGGLGGEKRPVDIVADYLAEVRKHLIKCLDDQYGKQLWRTLATTLVVTVPAVWSDAAKNLTMQAIEKAGFNTTELPQLRRTITTTEPEAAALYSIRSMKGSIRNEQFKAGEGFVVCDMGGGTVDIISYRVAETDPLMVEEATTGIGDQCGGSFVERAFPVVLEKKLGPKHFMKLAGCRAADLLHTSLPKKLAKMVEEFARTAKIGFKGSQEYYFSLPHPLSAIQNEDRGICDGEVCITA